MSVANSLGRFSLDLSAERLLVAVGVPLIVAFLASFLLARVLRIRWMLAALTTCSLAAILGVTIFLRVVGGITFPTINLERNRLDDLFAHAFRITPGWLANVAMFLPSALLLTLATRRARRVVAGMVCFSAAIEVVQRLALIGVADPGDVVANSIGAMIGVLLANRLQATSPSWRQPPLALGGVGGESLRS